ncbi:MAG: (R)-hydratase [Hirschia sp.]|nr:(R)-hydratase [Hirschia sp.]MBF19640.1 (R)-hydratase [Hirschia sp.]|tara:strand:- start:574 stop:999 length:426 start_codon:yes stop_codon:yes gene_type:complete
MKPGLKYEDLELGMSHEDKHVVTEQDVIDFARISGDHNPLHMDEEYAKTTIFGERIAHGALTASYVSAILGNDLPGPGAIFTDLNLRFKRPVKIGDTVVARAEVSEMIPRGNRVTLSVKCMVDGKTVIQGEAKVMVPSRES